jgi:hypothetical protein
VKIPIPFALLTLGLLAGCSPDSYKEAADRQVTAILRDRGETTLGYKPQVEVKTDVPQTVTKAAYAKIPTTPLPPMTPPPIQPVNIVIPYGPLGPERLPFVAPITGNADA